MMERQFGSFKTKRNHPHAHSPVFFFCFFTRVGFLQNCYLGVSIIMYTVASVPFLRRRRKILPFKDFLWSFSLKIRIILGKSRIKSYPGDKYQLKCYPDIFTRVGKIHWLHSQGYWQGRQSCDELRDAFCQGFDLSRRQRNWNI